MTTVAMQHPAYVGEWRMPSRGVVGMLGLITAESAIFTIFVVAYLYYTGTRVLHPSPREVLDVPILATVCLLSSSFFIWLAEKAIHRGEIKFFALFWAVTWLLGAIFLGYTAAEWHRLIYHENFTVGTNVFSTAFYSLVGLHASHVIVGLSLILIVLLLTVFGKVRQQHAERITVLAMYWHFVDAVWVVVFTVVYIVSR
jgi:cytochrome c oxidase subunit 3/cytochrome o ubiquinol oxidase subunit 3